MDIDWPPRQSHAPGAEYVEYAQIYDALFDDLKDDARFYCALAEREFPAGGEILELGIGTGRLAEKLILAGHSLTGIDVSPEMMARAQVRLAPHQERCRLIEADVRTLSLGRQFSMVVAPYGMVAHLLTDQDRLAAFHSIYQHVRPGGIFCFDDKPDWLSGPADSTHLELAKTGIDPATGQAVRLMTNLISAAEGNLSVRYDIIDWLKNDCVSQRLIVRVIFRNTALPEELQMLAEAGFEDVELLGNFEGEAFNFDAPHLNKRLIYCCRRPA